MADDNSFKTGDSLWILTRKILGTLQAGGGGGGGGGGGAVTIADGADVTLGSKADATAPSASGSLTAISLLKGLLNQVGLIYSFLIARPAVSGNVGGITTLIKDTTAVSTSAYSAGDAVGAKRTFANAFTTVGTGILESITILDRANQKAAMTLFIFDSDPSAATITDNAAFVFSTDDLKVIAQISIATGDYVSTNSKAIAQKTGLGIALKGGSSSLYGALVTTGTPTFAATSDVQLEVGILQD